MLIDDGINGFSKNLGLIGLFQFYFSLLGMYASIDANHGRWVIESKLCIFLFLNFFNFLIFGDFFQFFNFFNFWEFFNFCDVRRKGVGLCPYMGNECVYVLIWFPPFLLGFLGCIKLNTPYYCQLIWNLVGSIYGRSSIKIANLIPIH